MSKKAPPPVAHEHLPAPHSITRCCITRPAIVMAHESTALARSGSQGAPTLHQECKSRAAWAGEAPVMAQGFDRGDGRLQRNQRAKVPAERNTCRIPEG